MRCIRILSSLLPLAVAASSLAADHWVWKEGQPQAHLVIPQLSQPYDVLVPNTLNEYLADSYGWSLPSIQDAENPGLYILVGDERNNFVIGELVLGGLKLNRERLGDEGYRLLTHEVDARQFVIVTANTPAGLKFGLQELMYFHMPVATEGGAVEWPLDVVRKPAIAYRGTYMLPCWSAHDSLESWKRVLKFNSELTLNRNWFWLSGFPVLAQYGGEFKDSDLASIINVQGLVSLCRSAAMKFYIGGGWFTWQHATMAQGSMERGVRWYIDLLRALPEAEGIYLEPAGEGSDIDEKTWQERTEALGQLTELAWRERPQLEFAIAIGKFNAKPYREAIHQLDEKRVYWWWCWGDPIAQKALDEHPLVLRWHTNVQMSNYHGSIAPPGSADAPLTGVVTSYDPGQGFGNPWNGWGKLGTDQRRDVDPYTMPYFSQEYWFRERCWDVNMTPGQFAARLQRRLFDADAPAGAIGHYLKLADFCPDPRQSTPETLEPIEAFVKALAGKGTPRQRDTLARMTEALKGIKNMPVTTQTTP